MSSQNEPVKPTAFSLADPQPAPVAATPVASGAPKWVLPTLAGLLVFALVVVFWLPSRIDGASPTLAETGEISAAKPSDRASDANTVKNRTEPEQASPWSDAQQAKLRKEAQNVLAILLDAQFELQELGVEQWAAEAFTAAKNLAAQGDLQYRERQFIQARASYEQALTAMETLTESAPLTLQKNLELARQAIEKGDREGALAALAIATYIDPASAILAALNVRVDALAQLLPLLSRALDMEQSGDLAGAQSALQQATVVDPQHLKARAELARVSAAHTLARFNRAMSEGYSALGEGQFSKARSAFQQAEKLSPGSAETSSAAQDLEMAETAWRLAKLQNSGQQHEAGERWQQAVETFEKALAIDQNLLFAQQGLKRSRTRAQLDKQFRSAIDKPQRLSDKAVAQSTAQLMRQAASISPRGPILEEQLATLGTLLKQAGAQIQLTLRSDGQTEVTLRKVSRLGQFHQKVLTVRPGTYTVIGSRNGYRDIRRSFTLNHDSVAFELNIICTEEI